MTPEEHNSLLPANVKGKACQNLLEGAAAKDLAIEHIFERASVARALHAAEMLLRRGIGRMSVEEARVFTKTDPRFVPLDPDGALVTAREVLAEESAMVETARAGQGKFAPIGRSEVWVIRSPVIAQSKEQTKAVHEVLGSRDLVTTIHGPAGSGKTTLMSEAALCDNWRLFQSWQRAVGVRPSNG
jgi:predicted ribonuclease YlaK